MYRKTKFCGNILNILDENRDTAKIRSDSETVNVKAETRNAITQWPKLV